jgi:hypothetical protein
MCIRKAGFRVGRMRAHQEHKTAMGANMSLLSLEGKDGLWFYSIPHQSIAKLITVSPLYAMTTSTSRISCKVVHATCMSSDQICLMNCTEAKKTAILI